MISSPILRFVQIENSAASEEFDAPAASIATLENLATL
jgi:hypothetical protein